jgi:hypothetical protein
MNEKDLKEKLQELKEKLQDLDKSLESINIPFGLVLVSISKIKAIKEGCIKILVEGTEEELASKTGFEPNVALGYILSEVRQLHHFQVNLELIKTEMEKCDREISDKFEAVQSILFQQDSDPSSPQPVASQPVASEPEKEEKL